MTSANDLKAARETYEGFLSLIKVAVPVIALIVAFVILIIQ
ncbi:MULTISPECIES: aa3-type cytochrome c oxidase subunit IV [unclassified Novosphingobium]|nr:MULTISPECIES: aa3-type cytochrome c oxidase subunit IV [unclassified Novosphingobium]NKJ41858.1 tRNA threonylcarbamoyladenosine modification (KEOPS) complex Pcc1 subunit [Novosphingobium sp. SG720]NMN04245.1 tRNA threonylcarbamoyladenosine modification (KEOPS) complex Pcc1 subunit [Novosphingobium sp. SG919]NMN85764.1 tRNA threonylcarbamoyladenosine modification (KEOPS) complex Pcc1 subunit [Novosphingobium sp. SG916]